MKKLLVLSAVLLSAVSASAVTVDGIFYRCYETGFEEGFSINLYACVSDFDGKESRYNGVVTIPETVIGNNGDTYTVAMIDENTFDGCAISGITLPNTIEVIDEEAFRDCVNLTELTLPEKVRTIDEGAFKGCSGLKKIYILGPVTDIIDHHVFTGCTGLTDVYCYSTTPPNIERNTFESEYVMDNGEYHVRNIILHVPASALDDYKEHRRWGMFDNIVALTDDGMATHVGTVTVAPAADDGAVYDLSGRKVTTGSTPVIVISGGRKIIKK